MKNKKILIKTLIVLMMVFGIFTISSIKTVHAENNLNIAPADWAFTEESIPLHNAILTAYPAVDSDGDGYISTSEASVWTGVKIDLKNLALTGTLNGLQYFNNSNLTTVYLQGNSFTGSIPLNIGNMSSNLSVLYLTGSNLTGSIPDSIWSLTNLTQLNLSGNKLSGELSENISNLSLLLTFNVTGNNLSGNLPESIGSLTSIYNLGLSVNKFSGNIPRSYGNLVSLTHLYIYNTDISGYIPESFASLTNLQKVALSGNPNLKGNPVEIFANCNTLSYLEVQGSDLIQAKPAVSNLTTFKCDNLAEELLNNDGSLKESVSQFDIDKAQESANWWSEPTKSEWQSNIDLAQQLLHEKNAKETVEGLFNTDGDIKDTIIQIDIDNAQYLVNNLSNRLLKDELQAKIDNAQHMLDAKCAVLDLFNPSGDIKDTVIQVDIDNAQNLVTVMPNGILKDALQVKLVEAQKMLIAKRAVEDLFNFDRKIKDTVTQIHIDRAQKLVDELSSGTLKNHLQNKLNDAIKQLNQIVIELPKQKPSLPTHPSVEGGSITNAITPATYDTTNITMLICLLFSSLTIIWCTKKREI